MRALSSLVLLLLLLLLEASACHVVALHLVQDSLRGVGSETRVDGISLVSALPYDAHPVLLCALCKGSNGRFALLARQQPLLLQQTLLHTLAHHRHVTAAAVAHSITHLFFILFFKDPMMPMLSVLQS